MSWKNVYTRTQQERELEALRAILNQLLGVAQEAKTEIYIAGFYGEVGDKLVIRHGILQEKFFLYEEDDRARYGGRYRYLAVLPAELTATLLHYRPELESLAATLREFLAATQAASIVKSEAAPGAIWMELSAMVRSAECRDLIRPLEVARTGDSVLSLTSEGLAEASPQGSRSVKPREFWEFMEIVSRYSLSLATLQRIREALHR